MIIKFFYGICDYFCDFEWIPACTGMTMKLLFTMLVFVIPHLLRIHFMDEYSFANL